MNLTVRSYKSELLDNPDIPFDDIRLNMKELNVVNTWLGGHAITVLGVKKFVDNKRTLHICEIGCGGGDNLVAIQKWCVRNDIAATFTGIDIKEACIQYAQNKSKSIPNCKWIVSDYREVHFLEKPDIIFSSLFCHHFTNEALVQQLLWMNEQSTIGFFINDLERNRIAYYSIKWITQLFSSSYLVKNDAPLSVARGFKKSEWLSLIKLAGLPNTTITWKWAFRYLVISKHE